jgi:hypothetical protein
MAFKNVSVVARNGIPLISVDGEIVAGMAFTLLPERRTPQYVKRLVEEAGIKMWFPIIICEWPGYESEKQYDFSAIEMILAADPDAMLIPRFALMPPESWKMKFPAEMAVAGKYSKKTVTPYYSIASELWLRSSQEVLEKLISTLEQHRCAQNVIGIFTGIGSHTEGGGWSCYMEKECYDFSEPNRLAFTHYLQDKYPDFIQLRGLFQKQDWKDWDDVRVPEFEERMTPDVGMFYDPAAGGVYIREYNLFENWLNFDRLEKIGKTVKDSSGGKLLYGCFHGYCGREFGGGGSNLHDTLNSKYIDFIAAPPAYDDRAPGGTIAHSMPIDSINLHGKIFINECDVRTSLAEVQERKYGAPRSILQSRENISHFLGYTLAHRNYGWYLEPGQATPERPVMWFNHPDLASTMSDLNGEFHLYPEQENKMVAEVAVIWDKYGGFDTSFTIQGDVASQHFSNPGSQLVNEMLRMEVSRIGTPVNFYLMEDLVSGLVPSEIKFFIFVNTWQMTHERRALLKAELSRRKATELWFYGSGFVDGTENELSVKSMQDLLGMEFSVDDAWGHMGINLTDEGRNLFPELKNNPGIPYRYRKTGLGLHSSFTPSAPADDYFSPFFSVKDSGKTKVLGSYQHNGKPAMAHVDTVDRSIYYSGAPFAPCDLLSVIAEKSGAHIYLNTTDAIYMNSDLLIIHASESGEKALSLPKNFKLKDNSLPRSGNNSMRFDMIKGQTKIIKIKQK